MSTGLRFTLEVDGLPPDAFAVVSFHLNQSLSSLFSLDLSLVSQQFLSLEFAQVEESKIALTPDGIQLQVGESTVIRLSKDGITIVGGSVFIN
ncbi:TPA: hypothetical protein NN260_004319 [Escherichia coli]|nr:hypothetical protein [Escherichia coli]